MNTKLEKRIVKPFEIEDVQHYLSNKRRIEIDGIMESGVDCLPDPSGMIVGACNGQPIYSEVETHGVVIGNTGSGKTAAAAISNLLSFPGSVISLEIGGATFKRTYNYRKHWLGQKIYIFDPLNVIGLGSSNYNPLDDLDIDSQDFYSRVLTMSSTLISDASGHKEQNPYFRENPSGLIAAMIVYLKLADVIPAEHKNFAFMAGIFSKFPSEEWNEHIATLRKWQGRYAGLLNKFGNYLSTAQPGDQNVRSVVTATSQWLDKWLGDDKFGRHMVSSDFSMTDLRNRKITLYIVMPRVEEYVNYQPWLRLILQSAVDGTPNPGDGGKSFRLEDRILFMIDELTQLGNLQVVTTGAQTVRQKGITFWSLFQDYSSLRDVYGEDRASAFLGSSEVIQFLRSHDDLTLEYISKHIGRYMVYVPSVHEGQTKQNTVGYQESTTEGKTNQKNWQNSKAKSVGKMNQETTSFTTVYGRFSSSSTGQNASSNDGSSSGSTEGTAYTVGQSTQETETVSEGGGDAENTATQTGTNNSEAFGNSYAVAYQPMILDGMDFRQIKEALSGNRQILFTNGKHGAHCTLDAQARYYKIPFLKERAEGPSIPKAPSFPEPPEKIVFCLRQMEAINLKDFQLDYNQLNWKPCELVSWQSPSELPEWRQGGKASREAYESARYRLDKIDQAPGIFRRVMTNPYVKAAAISGVAASCCVGNFSIALSGLMFGAMMMTGAVYEIIRRNKVEREKFVCWKKYSDVRGQALRMIIDQLSPVMASQDKNDNTMRETVAKQHELILTNKNMATVGAEKHVFLKDILKEYRAARQMCQSKYSVIWDIFVSGWSSGDWGAYVRKLDYYGLVREKFFDFEKGDYLPAPNLVTPEKLGPLPANTHTGRIAPLPEIFEADAALPLRQQKYSSVPVFGQESRKPIVAYIDMPLDGYDLPDGVRTVRDAVTYRAKFMYSEELNRRRDVMQIDAALEVLEDPYLEKINGLVKEYVMSLRKDEYIYKQILPEELLEAQKNIRTTVDGINRFNDQVGRLSAAQKSLMDFAKRLDEIQLRAHHRAHARAIKEMEMMELSFSEQTLRLKERGPLVLPKEPTKMPNRKALAEPK